MKIERANKIFQPIELKITIETEEELRDLHARLVCDHDDVNRANKNDSHNSLATDSSSDVLYNFIYDMLQIIKN